VDVTDNGLYRFVRFTGEQSGTCYIAELEVQVNGIGLSYFCHQFITCAALPLSLKHMRVLGGYRVFGWLSGPSVT
jgi:hypothetical protein